MKLLRHIKDNDKKPLYKCKYSFAVVFSAIAIFSTSFVYQGSTIVMAAGTYTITGISSQKLYESASESSKVVANLIPENTFTIIETVKDAQGHNWHHVSLSNGTSGYLPSHRVAEASTETQEAAQTASTTAVENEVVEETVTEEVTEENTEEEITEEENTIVEDEGTVEETEEEASDETTAIAESLVGVYVTTITNSNLRSEPNVDADVLVVIPGNVEIEAQESLIEDEYTWYKISYLNSTGYVREDNVSVSSEDTEETLETEENASEASTTAYVNKVIKNTNTTSSTVSYEESYERRHKWDDPETTSSDEEESSRRIIDIYVILYIMAAVVLLVLAVCVIFKVLNTYGEYVLAKRKGKRKIYTEKQNGEY
ncbi:MAG: SH3 domain-containing protein [Butyrivibrio sp.]|nr:SH3 domain-containing protein [Butyrivibrio sp.]